MRLLFQDQQGCCSTWQNHSHRMCVCNYCILLRTLVFCVGVAKCKSPSSSSIGHIYRLSHKVSHPVPLIGLMRVDKSDQQTYEILLCWKHLLPPTTLQSHCSLKFRENKANHQWFNLHFDYGKDKEYLFLHHFHLFYYLVTTANVILFPLVSPFPNLHFSFEVWQKTLHLS